MGNTYKTSLHHVPGIIKRNKQDLSGKFILNYGCGVGYDKVDEYFSGTGTQLYHYDPHSPIAAQRKKAPILPFQRIVCANVLNVIQLDADIDKAIISVARVASMSNKCIAYFSIYEGKRNGVGGVTIRGYQRNEKAGAYTPILKNYFSTVKRNKEHFICIF